VFSYGPPSPRLLLDIIYKNYVREIRTRRTLGKHQECSAPDFNSLIFDIFI
jgi:hypothetical protein